MTTDQDRGEGRAPFLEDGFSDGGSGGSGRVVPGHSGKDWAAEIGNGVIRMKEETQQSHGNTGNHGGGVFASGRKWALGAQKGIATPLCQENNRGGLEKSPCKPVEWEENHEKGSTPVVAKKPYGKSQITFKLWSHAQIETPKQLTA